MTSFFSSRRLSTFPFQSQFNGLSERFSFSSHRWRETGDAACDPYRPWQTVYNHRPWQQLHLNTKQILGGEVALWSEQLDEGSLDARLWPRAAAFAERVWSDPQLDVATYNIQEDVYTRLSTHRDRLVSRGLNAEALWPSWCTQNPGMCL